VFLYYPRGSIIFLDGSNYLRSKLLCFANTNCFPKRIVHFFGLSKFRTEAQNKESQIGLFSVILPYSLCSVYIFRVISSFVCNFEFWYKARVFVRIGLERLAGDKHSSLLQKYVKSFITLGPGLNVTQLFCPQFTIFCNKLKCLSLASFPSLV
jgi:hypothetical protein